jgi:PAS domain S-box-containing protein
MAETMTAAAPTRLDSLIANSPVASVVSNPRLQDNPIIACNQAFKDLTGYDDDEIIGRNCRFLAGAETEPWLSDTIRDGVRERRPVLVEILNYKKNGTPFRNALLVAPIFDTAGELEFFLGSQVEIPADAPGIRAGAHGDINLITLLLGAEEGGLQLLTRQGEWLSIAPPEGALVINVGDMLERLTNNQLPSTIHRVLNPPPERRHIPRYSMPFFLHLASDVLIETLPGCIDADHPNLYPSPITANDFLVQRLIEIGLKT